MLWGTREAVAQKNVCLHININAIQFQNFNATENVKSYMSTIFETKWNHMKSTEIMVQLISLQNQKHPTKSKPWP